MRLTPATVEGACVEPNDHHYCDNRPGGRVVGELQQGDDGGGNECANHHAREQTQPQAKRWLRTNEPCRNHLRMVAAESDCCKALVGREESALRALECPCCGRHSGYEASNATSGRPYCASSTVA